MASLYLHQNPFAPLSKTPFFKTLIQSVSRETSNTLIVVPHQIFKQNVIALLARELKNGDTLPLVLTCDEWALVEEEESAYFQGQEADQLALENIIRTVLSIDPVWGDIIKKQGVVNQVRKWVENTKRYGFNQKQYQAYYGKARTEGLLLVIKKVKAWQKKKHLKSLVDYYKQAKPQAFWDHHLKNKTLYLMGFWELPFYQHALMDQWIKAAGLTVVLTYDQPAPKYQAVKKWAKKCLGKEAIVMPYKPHENKTQTVYLAQDREHEMTWVCDQIQKAKETGQIDMYSEVMIVLPNHVQYEPWLKYAAHQKKIPIQTSSISFAHHPLGQWILTWLQLSDKVWRRDSLIEWLNTLFINQGLDNEKKTIGYSEQVIELEKTHMGPLITPSEWVAECKREWEKEKGDLLANKAPVKFEKNARWATCHEILEILKEESEQINKSVAPKTLIKKIKDIINQHAAPVLEGQEEGKEWVEEKLDQWQESVEDGQGDKASLIHFLKKIKYPNTLKSDDAVQVTGKFESFAVEKTWCILVGAVQGSWPTIQQSNMCMSDTLAEKMGWPTKQGRYETDQYLFHSLIAQENCTVTAPQDVDGNMANLSPFLENPEIIKLKKEIPQQKNNDVLKCYVEHVKSLYDGPLINQASAEIKESWSPTALELYQRCPTRFFYQRTLKCPEETDSNLELNPMQWGQWVHACCEVLLKQKKIDQKTAKEQIKAQLYRIKHPFLKQKAWQDSMEDEGVLTQLIDLLEEVLVDWKPIATEQRLTEVALRNNITINGQVDVVFEHRSEPVVLVCDFKTSAQTASSGSIDKKESLQLPIYMMAIEKEQEKQVVAGTYIQLHRNGVSMKAPVWCKTYDDLKKQVPVKFRAPLDWDDQKKEGIKAHIHRLITLISSNQFHYKLDDQTLGVKVKREIECRVCPYKIPCRYEEKI